jgi:hypothetical protein
VVVKLRMATPRFGYSGKTLAAKLGIAAGMSVAAISEPANYRELLGDVPANTLITSFRGTPTRSKTFDLVHLFVDRSATLEKQLPAAILVVAEGGALWISWPKKSSPLFIDLTDNGIRDLVLPTGFVDVKVAAVDENWSGLKFLRRRKK